MKLRKSKLSTANPGSNTGLNSQSKSATGFLVSIDTITVILGRVHSYERVTDIISLIDDFFGEKIEFSRDRPVRIPRLYHGSTVTSLKGVQVLWRMPGEEWGQGEMRIHVPGKALRGQPAQAVIALFSEVLAAYEPRCSRLDIAVDDLHRVGSMDDWLEASKAKNYTGVRRSKEIVSRSLDSEDTGITIYFGSAQSEKMIRVYDKFIESGGRINCIRIEGQFRKSYAEAAFNQLESCIKECLGDLPKTLAGIIFGQFSVIDRASGDKNIARKSLLPWFSRILKAVGSGIKLRLPRPEKTLEKTAHWVERAVAPSLAMLKRFYGDSDFWQNLNDMVDVANANLTKQKRGIVEATRLAFDWVPDYAGDVVVDAITFEQLDFW